MAEKSKHLFDNPRNVKRILYLLYISCGILFVLDFIVHRHISHGWEELLGFYSIYGFIGCAGIIFCAKALRYFVKRRPDYYERGDDENKEVHDVVS